MNNAAPLLTIIPNWMILNDFEWFEWQFSVSWDAKSEHKKSERLLHITNTNRDAKSTKATSYWLANWFEMV